MNVVAKNKFATAMYTSEFISENTFIRIKFLV